MSNPLLTIKDLYEIGLRAKKRQAEHFRDKPEIHKMLLNEIEKAELDWTEFYTGQLEIKKK